MCPGTVWSWGRHGVASEGGRKGFELLEAMSLRGDPFLLTDIPEIPESIKFCKALEIADFSGNPLSRWVVATAGLGMGSGGSAAPVWASEDPLLSSGSLKASLSYAVWLTWR